MKNKQRWLYQLRRCSSEKTLATVSERIKGKLPETDIQRFLLAVDHRLAEIRTGRLFDKIPPEVWELVHKKENTNMTKPISETTVDEQLGTLTTLRRFARKQEFEWLEKLRDNLSTILKERQEEEELRQIELQELEEKRLKALAYIDELGLDVATLTISAFELTGSGTKKRKKTAAAPVKYRYTDENGRVHTWTGIGRPNKKFKELMDAGRDLDEFLIGKTGEVKDAEGIIADNIPAQS